MFLVYTIGFLAQAFFSARILIQWVLSEKAKTSVSPGIYWVLSVFGSYLLFIYGWCRDDFSIILGQVTSYYIYIWNLNEKGIWKKLPVIFRLILFVTPIIAVSVLVHDFPKFFNNFFRNEEVPLWLLLFGSAGQIIFTLRFIYQWYYSYRRRKSILPVGFWLISLTGSAIIVSYGIFRMDPVLILGQSGGFIAYIRNIIIESRNKREKRNHLNSI